MKRKVSHRSGVPVTRIHPNDLKVIENVLMAYLAYLRHSNKQDTNIQVMQHLQWRLSVLLASSPCIDGVCILFTEQELHALSEALSGYVSLLCQAIPPSLQRREVIEGLLGLRQQIAGMLRNAI